MRLTSPFVALISGVAIPTILNVLYGICGQWLGGAISRQSWEPSSRGAGYQGASTPIKTVKRMINWFILCAVWRVGDQADYFGGWGLLCLKLSWSSYHNLGESSPTNILFVPKYKSQSRLVLCSKHKHRGARVEISGSEEEVNALFSITIFTTVFTQQRSIHLFISQMENGDCIIYGSEGRINQHTLNIWFAPIVRGRHCFTWQWWIPLPFSQLVAGTVWKVELYWVFANTIQWLHHGPGYPRRGSEVIPEYVSL